MQNDIMAPKAKEIPKTLKKHKEARIDNYFWLNDRENPEVIDYLNQENAFYQSMTAHTKGLQDSLYEEMKGRIKEDDSSVPYFYNGYFYITVSKPERITQFSPEKKEAFRRKKKFCSTVMNYQ